MQAPTHVDEAGERGSRLRAGRVRDLATLVLAAGLTVMLMFLMWEGILRAFAHDVATAYKLHFARGVSSSLVTALVVGWISLRQHRLQAGRLEAEVIDRTAELEEARTLLQVVVENTPAGLLVVDDERRVIHANRTARQVHGTSPKGQYCYDVLMGLGGACATCPSDGSKDGVCEPRQMTDPRTGEALSIESHPLRLPNGRLYRLLVERVLTEQKKLQTRIIHQEKMAAFGLLAAGLAHDLGNPLSSMSVQLQLLDRQELAPRTADVVGHLRQEVGRLQRLLRELVDFARRRRDHATLVSVESVVRDTLTVLRHDRRMSRIEVEVSADPETPPVKMIEDHLVQVVMNLVINALDAMDGEGVLKVEVRPVTDRVTLRIRDTGAGMDRSTLTRCFEPLFTTKESGRGTGLGLTVCREIVEDNGGTIDLHSSSGRGTVAIVTLPAAGSEETVAITPGRDRRARRDDLLEVRPPPGANGEEARP
jgi:C4-dicarboxylate-specific signal transduction histidine kinase